MNKNKSIKTVKEVVKTTSETIDAVEAPKVEINKETLDVKAKTIVTGERVKYVPSQAFRLIFPNGHQLFINGIVINLIFDGRAYNFTPKIRDYVEKELNKIASFESDKLERFNDPKRFFKNIG